MDEIRDTEHLTSFVIIYIYIFAGNVHKYNISTHELRVYSLCFRCD